LITSARVRNLISQQDGIKAAYFGFLDRFRALPGDYTQASANLNCTPACSNGNGNGQITPAGVSGATIDEHIAVWEHLSKAGFVNGSFTYAAGPETATSAATNPYIRYIRVIYDTSYGGAGSNIRHNVKTGNQVPSDIMAEIDRKIDDGNPLGGNFQFSAYDGGGTGGTAPDPTQCYTAGTPPLWSAATVITNCGGASLL
jgi:hypothetical protein